MRSYKVGDVVQIREWDDMEREFGLNAFGIKTRLCFINGMRQFCSKQFLIYHILRDDCYKSAGAGNYIYSSDMFEKDSNSLAVFISERGQMNEITSESNYK